MTGLVCPLRVQLREGGSETRLNTDRVPSTEALARRVLSSLANDMARTVKQATVKYIPLQYYNKDNAYVLASVCLSKM